MDGPYSSRAERAESEPRLRGLCTADGAHVIAYYGSNHEAARQLLAELGDRATVLCADLRVEAERADLWRSAVAWRGSVDVLVNNAGVVGFAGEHPDAWAERWTANLTLNLQAPADLCRLAIEHFTGRAGGVIVNVASRSSHRGDDAEHLAYGAAKGGLLALTKGIARGFGHERVPGLRSGAGLGRHRPCRWRHRRAGGRAAAGRADPSGRRGRG